MREKLNDNPLAQAAIVGVLLVVAAAVFLMGRGRGGKEQKALPGELRRRARLSSAAPAEAGSPTDLHAAGHRHRCSTAAAKPEAVAVERAYEEGKTVALLIYRPGGHRRSPGHQGHRQSWARCPASTSSSLPPARSPATRQITGPLGVDQAPALIVVSPRRSNGGGQATASVDYGFHSPASSPRQWSMPAIAVPTSPTAQLSARRLDQMPDPTHATCALSPSPATDRCARARGCSDGRQFGRPGLTHPLGQRPQRRLRHRRDRRPRLRHRRAGRRRRSTRRARPAGRRRRCCSSRSAIDADQLSRAIAERYGLDHVDLSVYQVDMARREPALGQPPRAATRRCRSATSTRRRCWSRWPTRPTSLAVDDIQMMTGLDCRVAVAAADDIEALIGRLNTLESAVTEAVVEDEAEAEDELGRGHRASQVAPRTRRSIKLVYSILGQAVGEGASDIHFEPERGRDAGPLPRRRRAARGGARAEADGHRRRLAGEDHERPRHRREAGARRTAGSASPSRTAGSTCASPRCRPSAGEGATIRILDKEQRACARSTSSAWTATAASASRTPFGQALRRGPGHRADRLGQVDDALRGAAGAERRSRRTSSRSRTRSSTGSTGINQINVNRKAGLDFATGPALDPARRPRHRSWSARSATRETARIAIEAALTGHMVLTHAAHQRRPGRDHPADRRWASRPS